MSALKLAQLPDRVRSHRPPAVRPARLGSPQLRPWASVHAGAPLCLLLQQANLAGCVKSHAPGWPRFPDLPPALT